MTRRPNTYARVTDAVDRVQVYAHDLVDAHADGYGTALALDHLCEALDKLMRNNPVLAEGLETFVADACDAVGVEGP